jgi:hypothetical protein
MTGTPLDLTPFGPLLKSVGYVYWLIALGLAGFALWVPGRWWVKAPIAALILGGFAYPVITQQKVEQQQVDVAKARLDTVLAHFEMRCKGAGEKITRTVDNVESVVWMKWRDKAEPSDDADQFKLFDPFGRDCTEHGCIEQLLRVTQGQELDPDKKKPWHMGYRFVESIDPRTQAPYRYTRQIYKPSDRDPKYGKWVIETELIPQPIQKLTARYGITWDDISTREDREHWIAGGSIKVIDLQNNEVIAERVGYMMDRGLGSTAGFRSPWGFAQQYACPEFQTIGPADPRRSRGAENRRFITQVLLPSKGE